MDRKLLLHQYFCLNPGQCHLVAVHPCLFAGHHLAGDVLHHDTVVALHHLQGEDLHLHVVARVHGLVLVALHEDVDIVVQVQAVLVNWSGVIEQSSFTSHHVRILLDKVGTSLNEHSALLLLEMFYTDFLFRHVAHDTLKLYGKMCGLSNGRTGQ